MPREVAFTPDGRSALVVNRDTDALSFFDIQSLKVTTTIPVGDFPVHVAVTPDGRRALVPNVFSDTVSVIDLQSRTVEAHVPITGRQPFRVAVTRDSRLAVVSVINTGRDSTFSVIDLVEMDEVRSFPSSSQGVFGMFFTPESGIFGNIFTTFALAPDDATLVLPDRFGGRVNLYNLHTGERVASLATAPLPTAVDVSRNGKIAVVTHEGDHRKISRIDLHRPRVSHEFTLPDDTNSQMLRITPDGRFALVGVFNYVLAVNLTTGRVAARMFTDLAGDLEISFDDRYAFTSGFAARIIDLADFRVVRSITLASCVEAAVSPVDHVAVALNNRFREDVHVYKINGPAGFAVGRVAIGRFPEGDAPRTLALSGDGLTAVVTHNVSDTLTVIDVANRTILDDVPIGERPLGVAVTPDGAYAVVACGGDDTVSVVDLAAGVVAAELAVPQVPAEVLIAADGGTAYVSAVGGTDRLYVVDLDGPRSRIAGSVITGQMGSAQYTFNVFSGMALTPDGALLAVCVSFDNELLLIDPAALRIVARVEVGAFPIRAAFSPDGARVYVTHANGDDVRAVAVDGENSRVVGTVEDIPTPLSVHVDAAGAFVYVAAFDRDEPAIHVVDASAFERVGVVPMPSPPRAMYMSPDGRVLHVACDGGEVLRLRAAGADTAVVDEAGLSQSPSDLIVSPATRTALVALPVADGVDFIGLSAPGNFNCDPAVNLEDYARLAACLAGPAGGLIDGCAPADADFDADVDLVDFAAFQKAFNGR